ncbi:trichodiene oxygenase [Ilyonectria robusta]
MSTTTVASTPLSVLVPSLTMHNVMALVGLWLGYQVFTALYNISPLHPLSHIPGPKLSQVGVN